MVSNPDSEMDSELNRPRNRRVPDRFGYESDDSHGKNYYQCACIRMNTMLKKYSELTNFMEWFFKNIETLYQ